MSFRRSLSASPSRGRAHSSGPLAQQQVAQGGQVTEVFHRVPFLERTQIGIAERLEGALKEQGEKLQFLTRELEGQKQEFCSGDEAREGMVRLAEDI